MATQFIEDPDTKERIPFEWDKPTPPTPGDIDSLFKSVKASRPSTLTTRTQPGESDILTTAPPKWVGPTKTALDLLGIGVGGIAGGPTGAGVGHAVSQQVKQLLPSSAHRPADKMDFEKAIGRPLSDEEYQDILQGGPQWKGLYTQMGLTPPTAVESVIGKAGEVGMDFATGMALEGGARALPIPKILPMYARGRGAAATEVANIAKREGVTIPAADITGSTGQSAITSAVQKLPQSAKTMQDEAVKATSQFSDYVERSLGKLGGKKEPFLAGQSAKEGRLIKIENNIRQGTEFYDQAKIAAKDAPMTFDKVASAIEKVQSSDRYQILDDASKKEVDNFISLIKQRTIPESGEIGVPTAGGATVPMQISQGGGKGFIDETALEGVIKEGGVIGNFMEAEGFRRTLGNKVYDRTTKKLQAFGPMKDIYKAFEDDMAISSRSAGNEAYKAFKNARDFWAKNVVEESKGIVSTLGKTGPTRSISLLKNAPVEDLHALKASMPAENFTNFRQGMFTQILEGVSQTSPVTGEVIYNGPQLAKSLFGKHGIGEARLRILTSPEEFKFLKELATVGEKMGSSWRIAGNPSGTAHTLYVLHLLGQVGASAGAAVAGEQLGGKKTAAAAGIGAFLTPYALAKLITSKIGRQYLISGFPAAEKAVQRVLPPGIIATRGMLSKDPERLTTPVMPKKEQKKE